MSGADELLGNNTVQQMDISVDRGLNVHEMTGILENQKWNVPKLDNFVTWSFSLLKIVTDV